VVRAAAIFDEAIDGPFVSSFEELTHKDGPALVTADALKLSEDLCRISPYAFRNFSEAYRFAISEDGLKMSRDDSVKFAKSIASKSVYRHPSNQTRDGSKKNM